MSFFLFFSLQHHQVNMLMLMMTQEAALFSSCKSFSAVCDYCMFVLYSVSKLLELNRPLGSMKSVICCAHDDLDSCLYSVCVNLVLVFVCL